MSCPAIRMGGTGWSLPSNITWAPPKATSQHITIIIIRTITTLATQDASESSSIIYSADNSQGLSISVDDFYSKHGLDNMMNKIQYISSQGEKSVIMF